jgi:hypothetical protein
MSIGWLSTFEHTSWLWWYQTFGKKNHTKLILVLRLKADFWLVCGIWIPSIELNIALVLPEIPTRQVFVRSWYCIGSYECCWFFDTKTNTNLYTRVPVWYLPNTGSYLRHTYNRVIWKVTNPFFTLSLGLLSPPIPSFQWYLQSKDILISLSMKRCNSVWNAHTQHLMHKVRD